MPMNKDYKGTRSQPRALYLVALVSFGLAAFFCLDKQFSLHLTYDLSSPFRRKPPLQWRTRSEALSECARVKKPILYVLIQKGEPFAYRLESEGLSSPDVSAYINENFLPVRVEMPSGYSNEATERRLGEGFWGFTDQLGSRRQTGLFVVPYKLARARSDEISSSANLAELGRNRNSDFHNQVYGDGYEYVYGEEDYRYSGFRGSPVTRRAPYLNSYRDIPDLMRYLYLARSWHTLKPTRGDVKWLSHEVLKEPNQGDKPRLLVMVKDCGSASDSFRLSCLLNPDVRSLIESDYRPVFVEFHPYEPEKDKSIQYLKEQYDLRAEHDLPAVIKVDNEGRSNILRGSIYKDSLIDFLKSHEVQKTQSQ
ncbi:MAG: hypothetical protein BWY75_02954 [bacterium ADurb.Bin425]|nr:MAG: hypothetical protein BWY75_02954 [bacterium ADurb.Bin425]